MGIPYSALRHKGAPTMYGPNKTAVTADVTEMGFVFAFVIIAFSFFIILPGIRGWQRLYSFIRFSILMFVGAGILLSAWGQEWEKAEIYNTETAYKAFYRGEIHADIGVKIGLNSVNITLKAEDGSIADHPDEKINYNERFNFWGPQGRRGFGRFAGRINREFREAQWSGKPLPILWIAEYFALDGEDIRWGRSYRLAGFYTWMMVWTAFPLWILSIALSFMVLRYCGYFLMMTGGFLWLGNIMWSAVRFGSTNLIIPFSSDKILTFSYGPTFWLCFIAGLVAVVSGFIVFIMDIRFPNELTTFFNVDPLADYEETFVYDKNGASNGASKGGPSETETVVASKPMYRQRAQSRFAVSRRRPRSSLAEVVEEANGTHDVEPGERSLPSEKPAPGQGESIHLTEIKAGVNN